VNSKWLIGIIVLIILLGGIYFLSKNRTPTTTAPQTRQSTVSASGSQGTASSSSANQLNIVTLTKDGFSPTTLTIKAATAVAWVNKSGTDATVNSDPHPTHTAYSPLNLGSFTDGGMLSLSFDKPGTYGYHNHLNPSQRGTIVVK